MEARMTTKGQIVIPSRVRRLFGMTRGTRIRIDVDEGLRRIILVPVTGEYVRGLGGRFAGKGLLRALESDRKREKER